MKVFELIEKLGKYNPNAEINVVVEGHKEPFEICYGSGEGCTPQSCDCVDLMVDTSEEYQIEYVRNKLYSSIGLPEELLTKEGSNFYTNT